MATANSYAAATNDSQSESRLLALPAEIRNEILCMALVLDREIPIECSVIPEQSAWPAVADTCKQLREESLPIFFGNNTFGVALYGLDPRVEVVASWLRRLEKAPATAKRLIKPITMDISRVMVAPYRTRVEGDASTRRKTAYQPDFAACKRLISHISAAGLKSHQLAWPGVPEVPLSNLERWIPVDKGQLWKVCVGWYLFNDFVVSPLLREYGLYDKEAPPVDVGRQVDEYCAGNSGMIIPPGPVSSYGGLWKGRQSKDWYSAWLAGQGP